MSWANGHDKSVYLIISVVGAISSSSSESEFKAPSKVGGFSRSGVGDGLSDDTLSISSSFESESLTIV